jgi:hypothetical protein
LKLKPRLLVVATALGRLNGGVGRVVDGELIPEIALATAQHALVLRRVGGKA